MTQKELKRIVNEYCEDLKREMLIKVKLFEKDWNRPHVRALAEMINERKFWPNTTTARREIKKSMTYYEMF